MPLPTRRCALLVPLWLTRTSTARDWKVEIEQLTRGPKHHFFGYIGHVQNTPWNRSGRYMAVLETDAQDHMPAPNEAAGVALIDTKNSHRIEVADHSRAWNPQQGTMFYWNPLKAETELFFNDRDARTNRVFTVRYDISKQKRTHEYRYDDAPFGNGGVAQNGGYFLGLNYGRMARLRPVTGYPGAYDWTNLEPAPDNDGIFITEIDSGKKRLLVSFRQLAELIAPVQPSVKGKQLFINHTLWNRDGNRIYFFVRGDFEATTGRVNMPCTIHPDGTGLKLHKQFVGGHPEWEFGSKLIGRVGDKQILYDVDEEKIVGQIGTPEIIPDPEGDCAMSPDGKWFVNGYRVKHENFYAVVRRGDQTWKRTRGLPVDNWTGGDLRLDPAPCWNRTSDAFAVPAIADDAGRTRQTFLLRIRNH